MATVQNALDRNCVALKIKQNTIGRKRHSIAVLHCSQWLETPWEAIFKPFNLSIDRVRDLQGQVRQVVIGGFINDDSIFHRGFPAFCILAIGRQSYKYERGLDSVRTLIQTCAIVAPVLGASASPK